MRNLATGRIRPRRMPPTDAQASVHHRIAAEGATSLSRSVVPVWR